MDTYCDGERKGTSLIGLYTVVYDMAGGTKTIRVSEALHARIAAHRREGETMSDTLERLLGGPPLRDLAGLFTDEDAEVAREAIAESHREHAAAIDRSLDELG